MMKWPDADGVMTRLPRGEDEPRRGVPIVKMKTISVALLTTALIVGGCGKKESGAAGEASEKRGDPVSGYVRSTLESKDVATGMIGLSAIRAAVKVYQVQEGSNPNSLQDLVSKGYLGQLPPEPTGQRYLYDARTGDVQLADR